MKKRTELLELISKDPLGLFKEDSKVKPISVEDSILISSFEEIQDYTDKHNREPQSNISNIYEFSLFARLKAIRSDSKKTKILKKYDFGGLLIGDEIKEITLEDIISDDPYGLFNNVASDIFELKYVKSGERIKPDFLSRRKVCKDFSNFKEMFNILHNELACKQRRLIKYGPSDLQTGKFYALDGILLFLKSIDGDNKKHVFVSGDRERFDGRTLCIFDNGTQSDMLFRSLDKAMQLDGYSISELLEMKSNELEVNETDILNGYIYVLKSKNPDVQSIENLFKIGHTTGSVSERIRNAKSQATYLFYDVEVISTYRCLNIQTYNLEQTIHDFFSAIKLDIELLDSDSKIYKPREWFKVSYNVIEDAIKLIINNQISDYIYDPEINQIIKRHI